MRRALAITALLLVASCSDPIRDRDLDKVGGEDPAVPVGPLHRPGQPCLVCHGDDGPAETRFSFAGTAYATPGVSVPLHGAKVRLIDGSGAQYSVSTNCAGNFYVGADNYRPAWPVWMKLELGDLTAEMVSPTNREGSCGACHADPASPSKAGHVYLVDDETFSQGACE